VCGGVEWWAWDRNDDDDVLAPIAIENPLQLSTSKEFPNELCEISLLRNVFSTVIAGPLPALHRSIIHISDNRIYFRSSVNSNSKLGFCSYREIERMIIGSSVWSKI